MFSASSAETLLGHTRFPVNLVRPNGDIFYENRPAAGLLIRPHGSESVLDCLVSPSQWADVLSKIAEQEPVCDEPILLPAAHSEAETAYLTALPQYNPNGELDCLICVWASRRNAVNSLAWDESEETLSEYTRDLEALLEHRTYQQLLTTEQNEFGRQILDVLPIGILVASPAGDITYRNLAMREQYGLKRLDSLHANVRHAFDESVIKHFDDVAVSGRRIHLETRDPAGGQADLEIFPVVSSGAVERVVFMFTRPPVESASCAFENEGLQA